MSVLVTGAGGPAGVAVIRALAEQGERVVAADADPSAVGLRLAPDAVVLPRCDDPAFLAAVVATATTLGVDALVSTVAEELVVLARHDDALRAAGIATWLPAADAVECCVDKWRFAQALDAADVATAATGLASAPAGDGPWIVKPRFGRGSRDVYVADTLDDVAWACARVTDPIVQTRLDGQEFTVDALVDREGQLVAAVPRWRLETKAGISTKGTTFADDNVVDLTARTLAAVGLRGVANVQGFRHADGTATIVEVNPRFSGGLPLSLAAGSDLVGEYVRAIRGEAIRPERLTYTVGVTMMRFLESVFERP